MQAIETTANFDENGEIEIDDLPVIKNKKVKLLILIEENAKDEWYRFSGNCLSDAYSKEEPEYDLSMLKEPNDLYKP